MEESPMKEATAAFPPSREKYWVELSIEEKIERIRIVIHDRDQRIRSLNSILRRLDRNFEHHQHDNTAGIVIPLNLIGLHNEGEDGLKFPSRNSEEAWF